MQTNACRAVMLGVLLASVPGVAAWADATNGAHGSEPWLRAGRAYYFPVQPPTLARYGRQHHDYPAADIFVPEGSTVVAVTSGVVDETRRVDRWDPRTNLGADRGGLSVSIVGDDGVRYYASHLSAVEPSLEPGMRVYAGQPIGRSGKTGDAALTEAHVHFGISHPTFPGDWAVRRGEVPPYDSLREWEQGIDVTPMLPEAVSSNSMVP
jgi:peptidoglycan LD-endopeptidase LytH